MVQSVNRIVKSDLGKSISSGYLLFFLGNIVALFLTPYILRYVTKEEYGFYILCFDFLAWVGFLEFGTTKVLESKSAHLISKGDFQGLNKSFNSSFFFQIITGLLIIPFYYVLIQFGIDKVEIQNFHFILVIFSISAGLSVFKNLFSSIIIASKKVHLDNRIKLLTQILNYSLVLILIPFVGVIGLAIINLGAVILMLIRSNYRIKKLFPDLNIDRKNFNKNELKSLFSKGIYFSLGSIATLFLLKIDSFIISKEFSLELVASYYISIKLFMLSQKILELAVNNFRPHVAQMFGRLEFEKIKLFYELILVTVICVGSMMISGIIFFNQYFIELWVGKGYYIGDIFNLLFGYYIIANLITLTSRIVLVSSLYKVKSLNLSRVFEGLVRISLILLFINTASVNLLPTTSIIAIFIFGILFFHFQLKKYFRDNGNMKVNTQIPLISIIISVPFIILYFNIPVIYNLIMIPVAFTVFALYVKTHFNEFKMLKAIVLKE